MGWPVISGCGASPNPAGAVAGALFDFFLPRNGFGSGVPASESGGGPSGRSALGRRRGSAREPNVFALRDMVGIWREIAAMERGSDDRKAGLAG